MMKSCLMKSQLSHFLPTPKLSHAPAYSYINAQFLMIARPSTKLRFKYLATKSEHPNEETSIHNPHHEQDSKGGTSDSFGRSLLIAGAASVGVLALLNVMVDKAWALGPEGPLVEEFWENVRRYALYALTVSTGVIYTVFQPIIELLKNPISAVLVLIIIGGSIFIVSQILSAMVGVSDFSYEYAY